MVASRGQSVSSSRFCSGLSSLLPRFQPHTCPEHPPWLLLHSQFTHALPKKASAGPEAGEGGEETDESFKSLPRLQLTVIWLWARCYTLQRPLGMPWGKI